MVSPFGIQNGRAEGGARVFRIGIVAAGLFTTLRAVGLLNPFPWSVLLPVGFVLMMLLPFLVLNRPERQRMGFAGAGCWRAYGVALLWGTGLALGCFLTGWLLFGSGTDHWFVSVREYYRANPAAADRPLFALFVIFTLPALIFSPLGEEIFFRGFLHEGLRQKFSTQASTWLEAGLFGLTHLLHHGIARVDGIWIFHPLSGAIWVLLMTATGYCFARLRGRWNSLGPPIVAHAAFNLVMNLIIFGGLWHSPAT